MRSAIYSIIAGIVIAGIVHIVIILAIPIYATHDAWGQLETKDEMWKFTSVTGNGISKPDLLPLIDPHFRVVACRFSLKDSAVRIRTTGDLPFWSVAVFDRFGKNVYSFNDRTAVDRILDLVVVNPAQMAVIRQELPDSLEKSVLVEAEIDRGFVLIRALSPDDSWKARLDGFLSSATCQRFST